jgi:ribonucleotide reductase beta subunit family protein with ferritin-like domain
MAATFLLPSDDIDHLIPLETIPELAELQKELDGTYWRPDEIKFDKDIADWKGVLSDAERKICENAIVEFNVWDPLVSRVYSGSGDTFVHDVTLPQLLMMYTMIAGWEAIHTRSYAMMGNTLLGAKRMRELMATNVPGYIQKKAKWFSDNIGSRYEGIKAHIVGFAKDSGDEAYYNVPRERLRDHARQVTVTAAIEGLFFQPKFTSIYWLKKKGLMPSFAFANELISRDEGLHFRVAAAYLKLLGYPLSVEETKEIFMQACELECEGIVETHPDGLSGLSSESLCQFTRYMCDCLLSLIFEKRTIAYGVDNPFPWMVSMAASRITSFFEKDVSEYDSRTIAPQDALNPIVGQKW